LNKLAKDFGEKLDALTNLVERYAPRISMNLLHDLPNMCPQLLKLL